MGTFSTSERVDLRCDLSPSFPVVVRVFEVAKINSLTP